MSYSLPTTETGSEARSRSSSQDLSPKPLSRIQQVAAQQTPEAKAARAEAKGARADKDIARRLNEEKRTGVFNPYQRVEDNVVSGGKTRKRKHKKSHKKAKKSLRRKRH